VSGLSYETISARTGIEQAKLLEMAELFAKAERGIIICDHKTEKRLSECPEPHGSGLCVRNPRRQPGLNALCEENNEQGAAA
jgi:hypothetical protein